MAINSSILALQKRMLSFTKNKIGYKWVTLNNKDHFEINEKRTI